MKIYRIAKTLALISLAVAGQAHSAEPWTVGPKFECGLYRVKGKLRKNSQADFVLSMREKTSSPYELIILGGDFDEKIENLETEVTLEVYVPKAISQNSRSFVFLKNFSKNRLAPDEWSRLLKKETCGKRL